MHHNPAALLVIDVQRGLFKKSTPIYRAKELIKNINSLVARAHRAGAPVFYVQHADQKGLVRGSPEWLLHAELHPQPEDNFVHKQHGNAFEATDLEAALKAINVNRLVIAGLVTHGCVRATCIGARQLGYQVVLAKDGHSSYSKDAARLIEEWNQKLSAQGVELKAAEEIAF